LNTFVHARLLFFSCAHVGLKLILTDFNLDY